MKFNLNLLCRELGALVKGSDIKSDSCLPKIEYPMLFNTHDNQFSESIVYITIDRHFEDVRESFKRFLERNSGFSFSCICIGEPPKDLLSVPNFDIIWIDGEVTRTDLFNRVQEIFKRWNSWRDELDIIIATGGTLTDLVNASLVMFKNDICVTDQFSKVLAHRIYKYVLLSKEQLGVIKESEYLPHNMVSDGIVDERAGESFSSSKPIFTKMRAFQCSVLRASIPLSADYMLIVSVRQNYRDLDEGDCATMLIFLEMIKKLYSMLDVQNVSDGYISAHSTLKALLQGNPVSYVELIKCATSLGWSRETDAFICLCVDVNSEKYDQYVHLMRPFASISFSLQAEFGCISFVLNGRVVAIGNLTKTHVTEEAFISKAEIFARNNELIIGASSSYRGLRSLTGSFRQAFSALRVAYKADKPSACLYPFKDCALEIGMDFIVKEMSPEHFCPKSLILLARNDTELYESLKVYIESNCNASVASKTLFLQRNSLIYRLEKVKKKTSFDLDDPDTRLLIQISLKLIDLYGLETTETEKPISLGNPSTPAGTGILKDLQALT